MLRNFATRLLQPATQREYQIATRLRASLIRPARMGSTSAGHMYWRNQAIDYDGLEKT